LENSVTFFGYPVVNLKKKLNFSPCPRKKRIKFPWIKRFIIFTEKNVPENNVYTTFSQPLQWIFYQGRLAKNLNFFFKNLTPDSQKKRQNSAKKIFSRRDFIKVLSLRPWGLSTSSLRFRHLNKLMNKARLWLGKLRWPSRILDKTLTKKLGIQIFLKVI
jgi:hypothetical protein